MGESSAVKKTSAFLGSALFFVVAPGTIAVLIPWLMTHGRFQSPVWSLPIARVAGALLILAGLPGLIDSFVRFAAEGRGTPAPIAPTEHLVVTGLYRYVRNPMYVAVVALILGQGLLFGDGRVILYGAVAWLVCHLFVVSYEEPTLERTFGKEFELYRVHVRRWLPRFTPWRGE